jgi:hypothetical protein
MLLTEIAALDELLQAHAAELGGDFSAYRNHTCRVVKLIAFGLSRTLLREIFAVWPSAGFHRRLIQLTLQRWRSHPLSPLPMMKL